MNTADLLQVYKHQRDYKVDGSVYKETQCDFSYNSNNIEGSTLTPEQTATIFERNAVSGNGVNVNDVIEAKNHFSAFDFLLDNVDVPLSKEFICELHRILKTGTLDEKNPAQVIGDWKRYENTVGLISTASPHEVDKEMNRYFSEYEAANNHDFEFIVDFHYHFECIHPFSDGNGRVGRLVMFKECLRNDITPFIITGDKRDFYIRGLREYPYERGYLVETCRAAQDFFEARYIPLAESYYKALNNI